jgi:hypothetical protein
MFVLGDVKLLEYYSWRVYAYTMYQTSPWSELPYQPAVPGPWWKPPPNNHSEDVIQIAISTPLSLLNIPITSMQILQQYKSLSVSDYIMTQANHKAALYLCSDLYYNSVKLGYYDLQK